MNVPPSSDADALHDLATLLLARSDPALTRLLAEHGARWFADIGRGDAHRTLADGRPAARWQDDAIVAEIPHGARVLDLGCGGGELLARLATERGVRGQGVEVDPDHVLTCIERGVSVFQGDLDAGLADFADGAFDYAVLEETLQTLRRPARALTEMLRVARRGIVSFPNFGFWRVRLDLAVRGRMPVTAWLPHHWYDTPNIHCLSLRDFFDEAEALGLRLLNVRVLADGEVRAFKTGDNLYAEEVLCVFEHAPRQ